MYRKGSFEKTEEKDFLTLRSQDNTLISPKKDIPSSGLYEISSDQLEDLVSYYTDEHNKISLMENLDLLGGTKGIMDKLKTSLEDGIESQNFRLEEFGSNQVFEEPPSPFLKFLKESLSELMIIIL